MKTHHRPFIYESRDFKNMCALVVRDNAGRKDSFVWHLGRLVDWKFSLFNIKRCFPGNYASAAHLWFNYYDELIGFVISEDFDEHFDIIVLEEYCYLYPEMLYWVDSEWGRQYRQLSTSVVETHTARTNALKEAGYQKTEDLEMIRIFDTSLFSDQPYPAAPLQFQSMAENMNYEKQNILRLSAWPNHKNTKQMDDAIRAYVRTSPIYDTRFDFVLIDESGFHLSGCEAFIDRANNTDEIERVCTHSDHHNKGFSQIVLRSCLRTLYDNHISTAYLTGWDEKTIHLYGKLGHVKEFSRYFYKRDLSG